MRAQGRKGVWEKMIFSEKGSAPKKMLGFSAFASVPLVILDVSLEFLVSTGLKIYKSQIYERWGKQSPPPLRVFPFAGLSSICLASLPVPLIKNRAQK